MLKLALIGKNISHSKSQFVYQKILGTNVDYTLLDYDDEKSILSPKKLFERYQGISITSPYKEHFLNKVVVDENIKELNAINCLRLNKNLLEGTNTDFLALEEIIENFQKKQYKNYILLGNGAMFRVCKKIFINNNIEFINYSRKKNGDISSLDLRELDKSIIINTCSRKFVFNGEISNDSLFYDLNYSFNSHIEYFKIKKFNYVDGIDLLELQARYALKFWNLDN